MFKIYDGRESFFQWDLDRKLIVYDESIKEVHFCNRTEECSLVCETYLESGLTLVDVPNVLLQDNWRINVYAYDGKYTKHCTKFDVLTRSKPADYVYTETECKQWDALENRMEALENSVSTEGINKAVEDYLKENPVEAGATEAQAAQIEENKANIEELRKDAESYALKDEVLEKFYIDININGEAWVASATYNEIIKEVSENKLVYCRVENTLEVPYIGLDTDNNMVLFAACMGGELNTVVILEDNTVITQYKRIPEQISQLQDDIGYATVTLVNNQLLEYAKKTEIPSDEHINSLINTALGVIENGTY